MRRACPSRVHAAMNRARARDLCKPISPMPRPEKTNISRYMCACVNLGTKCGKMMADKSARGLTRIASEQERWYT